MLASVWQCAAISGRAADSALPPEASAGALAELPALGLAAAIAEAGRVEVPAVDPAEAITIEATQAARWTEGAYDVWHLTGGVTIVQGSTKATAHEAVVWIEQAAFDESAAEPRVRGMLVRMAGNVRVKSAAADSDATSKMRGPDWAGRFWFLREPVLDFASVVPTAGPPPRYEAPASAADKPLPADEDRPIRQAQFAEFGGAAVPQVDPAAAARRLRAFPRSSVPLNVKWYPSPSGT